MSRFGIRQVVAYGFGALFGYGRERQLWAEKKRRMEEGAQRREIERKQKAAEDAAAIRAFQQKGKRP